MLARRLAMLASTIVVVAAVQQPVAAKAEPWSFFDWVRPVPTTSADRAVQPIAPRVTRVHRQRVAAVVAPEPVRAKPYKIILVGIGF